MEISTIKRIQNDPEFYYTVEDIYLDVGGDGITISYYENDDKRHRYMCFEKEMATEIAKTILELTEPKSYAARC